MHILNALLEELVEEYLTIDVLVCQVMITNVLTYVSLCSVGGWVERKKS